MVDFSLYLAFVVAAAALCVAPGPDMMFIVAMGGRGGPATGMLAAVGVACDALVHAVAAMSELPTLFTHLPVLNHVLRWAGLSGRLSALLRGSRRFAGDLDVVSGSVFAALAVRLVTAP